MALIDFYVRNQRLSKIGPKIVSDSINYVNCSFTFKTDDWNGIDKWVVFSKGEESYRVNLIDDAIPKEAGLNLGAGLWNVSLFGENPEGTERITTNSVTVEVAKSTIQDGEPLPPIALTEAEQIAAKAQRALDAANEVNSKAENGDFDGKPGEDGFSPEIEFFVFNDFENEVSGTEIVATNKDGSIATAKIFDGKNGKPGKDGENATPEQIAEAVENYFEENPIPGGGSAEVTAESIENALGYMPVNPDDVPEVPTKVSELDNDAGYAKKTELPKKTSDLDNDSEFITAGDIPAPPEVPVKSVNGKTGAVQLSASDVGARAENWMPTAAQVGAHPNTWKPTPEEIGAKPASYNPTYEDVGADKVGKAAEEVGKHNVSKNAHNDIRVKLSELQAAIEAFLNIDDTEFDQLSELIQAIKDNAGSIEQLTNGKVNVADIVNNLTTNVTNKPLSAAQGVVLKGLVDSLNTLAGGAKTTADKAKTAAQSAETTATEAKNLASGASQTANNVSDKVNDLEERMDSGEFKFDPTVYGLPVLYLTGDTAGMSKDVAKTLSYVYGENSGSCTLKWQGSSSLSYEKKNYTIKFATALEIVEGWGAQTKYCLKANFIDHSHARNIVSARLWAQIVQSRSEIHSTLATAPNYGAVDGFPVVIMLNGEFHGLYTFNIPKDAWMFGMGSGTKEAFVCADVPQNEGAVAFKKLADFVNDFELEYSSDDQSGWVLTSLNTLIQAVLDSNGKDLDTKLAKYIDWESAIDYYIYTVLITGLDNTKKNYILATYDGEKWFYSAYDMDSTFGAYWDGGNFVEADRRPTFATRISDNLMALIWNYRRQALYDRAKEIMESVFSESNVAMEFCNFVGGIPTPILVEDVKLHPTIPCSAANNTAQILNYYRMRFALAVKWLEEAMEGYAGDTESEAVITNLVPTSIDTDGSIFNGTGYMNGYRLNSSGVTKEQADSCVTGFIPCTKNDTIRLTGVVFGAYGSGGADGVTGGNGTGKSLYSYLAIYDANKTKLHSLQCLYQTLKDAGVEVSGWTYPEAQSTDVITFDFSNYAGNMAYIRINAVGDGVNMIVTKNEEIT